ncbi:hypothetical protein AX14_008197 [Amanita brunnescens Koide BX004]|nr:hypothetical protein AX14_008197 [Amanita brunnescens Koide BX004]
MMVWKTLGRLHYAVRSDRLGMRALDRINPIAVTHNALCRYCEGTWIRAPEEDTPEQYVNDVALIRLPRLIDMFIMNPIFGGPNTQIQSFHAERFAGTWYRAPGAFIEIGHRLDVMVVRMKDGQLTFYFFRQIVKMRGEPDEDVKARERIGH